MDPENLNAFQTWAHNYGAIRLAKALGMTNRSSVHRWIAGKHYPNARWIPKILKLAKGQIKISDIIQ